jgi:hypothetical protein
MQSISSVGLEGFIAMRNLISLFRIVSPCILVSVTTYCLHLQRGFLRNLGKHLQHRTVAQDKIRIWNDFTDSSSQKEVTPLYIQKWIGREHNSVGISLNYNGESFSYNGPSPYFLVFFTTFISLSSSFLPYFFLITFICLLRHYSVSQHFAVCIFTFFPIHSELSHSNAGLLASQYAYGKIVLMAILTYFFFAFLCLQTNSKTVLKFHVVPACFSCSTPNSHPSKLTTAMEATNCLSKFSLRK